jgi:hypothetical protein
VPEGDAAVVLAPAGSSRGETRYRLQAGGQAGALGAGALGCWGARVLPCAVRCRHVPLCEPSRCLKQCT